MSDNKAKQTPQRPASDQNSPADPGQPQDSPARQQVAAGTPSSLDKARARAVATDATTESETLGSKRRRWPSVVLVLVAVASAAAWYAPDRTASWSKTVTRNWPTTLTWPLAEVPAVPPTSHSQSRVHNQKADAKPTAEIAALERRMATLEDRSGAPAAGHTQVEKRTIETLQTKVGEMERQTKILQQRLEALEREAATLRQSVRDVPTQVPASTATAAAASAPAAPVPAPAPVSSARSPAGRAGAKPSGVIAPIRPQAPSASLSTTAAGTKRTGKPAEPTTCAELATRYPKPILLQFGRNQDVLQADHQKRLAELSKAVAPCANVTLTIRGYTDARGSERRNGDLSRKRADLAARYIEQRGIKREQLTVSGLAAAAPLASNETEKGRARNRRVEVFVQAAQ